MKKLALYFAKKYAISAINDLLSKYKDNVQVITQKVSVWIERLDKISNNLKAINERVSDGKLEDSEVEDSVSDIEKTIKEW